MKIDKLKIGIIGLGLIGGSIGLSLKKNRLCDLRVGFGRNKERLEEAKKIGAIDEIGENLEQIRDLDIVFLALPVLSIIEIGKEISGFTKDAIICDVGSTKKAIMQELSPLIPRFVGCHPMAGSHNSGIKYATDSLFFNATVVITPNSNTKKEAKEVISSLWKKMNALLIEMNPEMHDEFVALSSHIPHITSNILVELISERLGAHPLISSGFRDMTRLALSDPLLWRDIFITNKENIINGLDKMIEIIVKWKGSMNDEERLANKLKEINNLAKNIFVNEYK